MHEMKLKVNGMSCEGCASRVKTVLEAVPYVRQATVDHKTGIAIIRFEETPPLENDVKSALYLAGYEVSLTS